MTNNISPNGEQFGIDELRKTVALFSNGRESFAQLFSAAQLVTLWRAYRACEWDIHPEEWSEDQITDCLRKGIVPNFDGSELPLPPDPKRKLAVTELVAW